MLDPRALGRVILTDLETVLSKLGVNWQQITGCDRLQDVLGQDLLKKCSTKQAIVPELGMIRFPNVGEAVSWGSSSVSGAANGGMGSGLMSVEFEG